MDKEALSIKVLEMLLDAKVSEKHCESEYDYQVGKHYFIRTVTHILVGNLVHKNDKELILNKCSWIADTGRYCDALKTGEFKEIEPYPPQKLVHVNRGSFIDASIWVHDLPTEQK